MTHGNVSRRKFLKTVSYAGGTLVIGATGAHFLFRDSKIVDGLESALVSGFKGKIIKDRILLEEYRTDFGNTIRREPRLIVIPDDDDDVAYALKLAAEYEVPVNIRGAGHTCQGQSLSDGGILIINNSKAADVGIENGRLSVHTKSNWMALEQVLNQQSLTSPVLTDYLDLTVGGTLSVGGYGLRSFQYGAQVDNITGLELLTADGQIIQCSPEQNSTLFRYALCGLGQLGFIKRVHFNAIPYKPITAVYYIMSRTVEAFILTLKKIFSADVRPLIDHFSAYWVNGTFFFELGKSFADESKTDIDSAARAIAKHLKYYKQSVIKDYHVYLHNVRKQWVDQYGLSHHLWEDYMLDIEALEKFFHQIISEDKINQQLGILPALYLMGCRCSQTNPIAFAPTYGISEEMAYSVGFYYMVKLGDTQGLNRAQTQLATNMERCLDLGGKPYLYGWHGLTEQQKVKFYQNEYEQLKQLKQKHDPANIFNPGVLL